MRGIKAILAAHVSASCPPGVKPDAVLFHGREGVAAVGRYPTRPIPLDPNRVLVAEGEGATPSSYRETVVAASTRACAFAAAVEGDAASALAAAGLSSPGDLVATVGLAPAFALVGTLAWEVAGADLDALLTTGEWIPTFPAGVHRVQGRGSLGPGVMPLDVGLFLADALGPGGLAGSALELGGPLTDRWDGAEAAAAVAAAWPAGAVAAMVAPATEPDADAVYEYDFTPLKSMCAFFRGEDVIVCAAADADNMFLDNVILGPGAGTASLRAAASLLDGKTVYSDCRLWIAPASRAVLLAVTRDGTLERLVAAGGIVLSPGANLDALLASGLPLTTSPRLFNAASPTIHLANAWVAAASALAGQIEDAAPLCARL